MNEQKQDLANVHIEHYFPKGYNPEEEPWLSIRKFHNTALAAERQRREQAEQTANHNADIGDSIARASKQVEESLRSQLLSAQTAIEKHNKNWDSYQGHKCYIPFDLSLLHQHDDHIKRCANIEGYKDGYRDGKEVRKPLVDLLEQAYYELRTADHNILAAVIRHELDSLAQCKEKQRPYPLPDGRTK